MKKNLLILFSLGLFIFFSVLLYYTIPYPNGHKELDSSEYESVAHVFARTSKLSYPNGTMPNHTVGYHFFLGIFYRLYGEPALPIIILAQILLGILCCLLTYALALKLFTAPVALIALLGMASNIGLLAYAQLLMADILLLVFLLAFLYTFVSFIYEQKKTYLIACALLLSISVLIKPVALYFIFPLLFFIIYPLYGLRERVNAAVLFALCFYAPICCYMGYNYCYYNVCAVTTLVQENLYIYFLPRRILPRLEPELQQRYMQQIESTTNNHERMRISGIIFNELLKKRPFIFFFGWAESMFKVFFGTFCTQLKILYNQTIRGGCCSFFAMPGNTALQRLQQYAQFGSIHPLLTAIAYLDIIWLLVRYLFVLLALLLLLYANEYFWFLFFNCYMGYFTFVAGHDGGGRYRLMFEPLLIILAAYALVWVYQKWLGVHEKKYANKIRAI